MEPEESEIVQALKSAEERLGTLGRFGYGLTLPYRMIGVLWRHRSLWKYVAVPIVLTIVIFAALVVGLVMYAPTFLGWLWPYPGGEAVLWVVLWYLSVGVVAVLMGIASFFATTMLSGVVASPFNDMLSMEAEALFSADPPAEESDEAFWQEILRSLWASLAVIALYAVVMVPLFVLSFTPVGFVAWPVQLTASAGFVALEFTDTPLSRRGLKLRERIAWLRANLPVSFGFGVGAAMLMTVPFVGLLTVTRG